MFLNSWLRLVALFLIIANIVRATHAFYDTKHDRYYENLDTVVSLALAGCFMLMMSQNLLVDAFGMIAGLILQVLQIGDSHLITDN